MYFFSHFNHLVFDIVLLTHLKRRFARVIITQAFFKSTSEAVQKWRIWKAKQKNVWFLFFFFLQNYSSIPSYVVHFMLFLYFEIQSSQKESGVFIISKLFVFEL